MGNCKELELRINELEQSNNSLKNDLEQVKQSIVFLENDYERIFHSLLSMKVSKKTIEELVCHAICQEFNVSLKTLFDMAHKTSGRPSKEDIKNGINNVIQARLWAISITRYILLRHPHGVKMAYPFYAHKRELSHREVFMGALYPNSEEDKKNRDTLLSICARIKQLMKENGISNDSFDYI